MEITKGLLMHWWHYYGKLLYSLAEFEEFEDIIDEYGVEKVLEVAVASYICNDGSPTIMLASIRQNTVKELFESLPDISTWDEKDKEKYKAIRDEFIKNLSNDIR